MHYIHCKPIIDKDHGLGYNHIMLDSTQDSIKQDKVEMERGSQHQKEMILKMLI